MATDCWGIETEYEDALGARQKTPEAIRAAVLKAMGEDTSEPCPPPSDPVKVVKTGEQVPLPAPSELELEDGTILRAESSLPPDLPAGYHQLRPLGGNPAVRLIVTPGRCYLPGDLRIWGWAVQLYAMRSEKSWGMGDLRDLRSLARWSAADLGANLLLLNPLNAASPALPQQASPYFPSSRRYRNPLYLCVEEVPGAAEGGIELERLAAAGRALNGERRIDRDTVFHLKMEALETIWARFGGDPAFDRYCEQQGEPLRQFAVFCTLAEHHGSGWQSWPQEFRHPDTQEVARFAADRSRRISFHTWLQWLLDLQVSRAAGEMPLMHDLPIGFDPNGADAWVWQDVLARDATVGAPPDEYNTQGQNWGFPPFIPHKLRASGYEPFRQTIQAVLRHAAGLRIDHVMGLFRLYWIPKGMKPGMGAYVRYRAEELLAVLAIESRRAKALVVGEDLGTVEKGVRRQLAEQRLLSYRLLWFEKEPTADYPQTALAAVTTHDLPTIAGLWSGSDLRLQRQLGLKPNEKGLREIRMRLQKMTGLPENAPPGEVALRAYGLLAKCPSAVVAATLDDALAVEERPNMPTAKDWPNWSLALPVPLETLTARPSVLRLAETIREGRKAR